MMASTRSLLAVLGLLVALLAATAYCSIPTKTVLRFAEVTEDKLAPHSISSSKLQRYSVATQHLQTGAVTSDKIGAYSVNERHIAPSSITAKSLAVEEITILLRADDYFIDDAQYPNPPPPETNAQGFGPASGKPVHPARTLLKPQDMRQNGNVENHYVTPNGFYYAKGHASGPGIILGWYPSLNGHLLRYQADRALRDLSCNAVHTRDNYVRKFDYNMADYVSLPSSTDGAGNALQPIFNNVDTPAAAGTTAAQMAARVEVVGTLETTAVFIPGPPGVAPPAVNPLPGTGAAPGFGSPNFIPNLSNLEQRPPFSGTTGVLQYRGFSYTHRADPYDGIDNGNAWFDGQNPSGSIDEQQTLFATILGVPCPCGITFPQLFDSAAVFTHSRVWNANNSPKAALGVGNYVKTDWIVPQLQNSPVLDTWMLVHRYRDIGFRDKCLLLPGTINGEDNVKCRQTQIWVDREYQSNYNQYATILPSFPYSTLFTDAITAKERQFSNIRSRDQYDPNTGNPAYDLIGSLDNVYPYLLCQPMPNGGLLYYDRGVPFATTDASLLTNMPPWTTEQAAYSGAGDRHQYCFIDGWRDRFSAGGVDETGVSQRLPTANAMFDNMPPERCSTYTNVGDLRLEAFDPNLADIPGPAEGTPVYSPSLERIEIDSNGVVTIGYAGRGLPGTTQPDIAITVVVLLNSGTQFQNINSPIGSTGAGTDTAPTLFP